MVKKNKKSFFDSIKTEIINDTGEYVRTNVKNKVLHIGEISVLVIIGFILISFGLAKLLENFFPILIGGYSYILLGIILLLFSYSIRV